MSRSPPGVRCQVSSPDPSIPFGELAVGSNLTFSFQLPERELATLCNSSFGVSAALAFDGAEKKLINASSTILISAFIVHPRGRLAEDNFRISVTAKRNTGYLNCQGKCQEPMQATQPVSNINPKPARQNSAPLIEGMQRPAPCPSRATDAVSAFITAISSLKSFSPDDLNERIIAESLIDRVLGWITTDLYRKRPGRRG